jgi:hypothetical protein
MYEFEAPSVGFGLDSAVSFELTAAGTSLSFEKFRGSPRAEVSEEFRSAAYQLVVRCRCWRTSIA